MWKERKAFLLNNIEHWASQFPRTQNPLIRRNYTAGNEQNINS